MSTHIIQPGENLTRIAEHYGFISNWKAIYYSHLNESFRKKRPNPMLVYPGDEVVIPPTRLQSHPVQLKCENVFQTDELEEDLIRKALNLHAEYIKLREDYIQWTTAEDRSSWRMIAAWTAALVEQDPDKYGDRVDQARLRQFQRQDLQQIDTWCSAYESKCRELADLMLIETFERQFLELSEDEQDEVYGALTDGLCECQVGRTYQSAVFRDDTSLLYKSVFKSGRKANTAFWRTLGSFAPIIALEKKGSTLLVIEAIIERKTLIDIVRTDILRARLNLLPAGSIVVSKVRWEIPILELDIKAGIKGMKRYISKIFDGVNVVLALDALREKRGSRDAINAVGAIASFIDKFEKAALALAKVEIIGLKLGKDFKAYKYLSSATGIQKLVRSATKISILSIVAGLCEAITGSMDAYDRASKGDYNAAIANGVIAVGGLASAIGAGMVIFGASTAWTGAGAIIMIVGAVVSLIATICAWLLTDTPIEEWLSNNRFAKRDSLLDSVLGSVTDTLDRLRNYPRQINDFKKIIQAVQFEAEIFPGHSVIIIKPTLVLTCSRVTMDVTYSWDYGVGCLMRDTLVDERQVTKIDGQRVEEIRIYVPNPESRRVLLNDITVTMYVDVYNDKKFCYPTKEETLKPGILTRVVSCF